MKIGDLESTSKGRYLLNTWLMPRMASILKTGEEVLFVGTDTNWDYKPFFWNPGKQCPYITIDIAERYKPDLVADIQNCPQIPDNKFSLVIMIGVHEFLDHIEQAYSEIHRILVPNGYLLIAFPGKGYYPDNRGVAFNDIQTILSHYRTLETYCVWEGNQEPNSVIVLAQKKGGE